MTRPAPAISVVIPTCRRAGLLDRCLAALAEQDLDEPFEVVVANDAPDAQTRARVEEWRRRAHESPHSQSSEVRHSPDVRYLPVIGTRGPAAARNRGWRAAQAPLLAFTDDDTVPAPDWLRRGRDALRHAAAAAGHIRVPRAARPTDYELDASRLDGAEFATANCFVRREALIDVGGFDERYTAAWREDSDLYFALLARGHCVARAAGAIVLHPVRPARWGVSLAQQRKILFDALLFKKHPRLFRQKVRKNPPWSYFAIVLALLVAPAAALADQPRVAGLALAVWALLTARFCALRLRNTSRKPAHVAEMVLTSMAIPLLATLWRLVGALRFRSAFP